MGKYQFDEIIERRGTCSTKWESAPDGGKLPDDIIPMWVADMDFPCAPPIVEAVHAAADHRVFGYSNFPADYFQTVADFQKRRHNFTVSTEDIIYTEGVVPALSFAVQALSEPEDAVIIQPPVYYPFFNVARVKGRTLLENKLINNNGYYTIDFVDLERLASDPRSKILLICSPHNPVGRVWKREELIRMQEICVNHGLILLCDEIHNDLIRGGYQHHSVMELFPDADNVVCCTAPSKTFNIAGLGASHMFTKNRDFQKKIRAVIGYTSSNPLTSAASQAALSGKCDDWIDELNEYQDTVFARFYELVAELFPKAVVTKTEGTYLAWVDVTAYTSDTKSLEKKILDDCHVYLEAGDAFGGPGFLRVNLGCPMSYLEEAAHRIATLL